MATTGAPVGLQNARRDRDVGGIFAPCAGSSS
jgi:hypothetical protein